MSIKSHHLPVQLMSKLENRKRKNQAMLFSITEEMDFIDPLAFYYGNDSVYSGERFFWKDSESDTIIVGVGNAAVLRSEKGIKERYKEIEDKWNHLLKEAVIENAHKEVMGTGPLLFGGFSFDPGTIKEEKWAPFSSAYFVLPSFMVTIKKDRTYLTSNVIHTAHEEDDFLEKWFSQKEKVIRNAKEIPERMTAIVNVAEHGSNEWKQAVHKAVEQIHRNETLKKVVLARMLTVQFQERPFLEAVLKRLWEEQHESFLFALETMNRCFLGASPERLVQKWHENVLSTCLAGSIRRGKDLKEDQRLGQELMGDRKNRKEHQLVVDMIGSVINSLCENVQIPEQPELLKLSDIQHLFTPVVGKARRNMSVLQFVERLHPTPALGGLPQQEGLEKIRQLEEIDRGLYGGPIGWIDGDGNGEFAVAIRSGLFHDAQAYLYAGCGIVADSEAESEYIETSIKFRPMLRAIGGDIHE
ncbi:isochorismate synthase [Bacillus smithii]|uniref:isochorismate synthase n=1 Tax=Bacillus smithii TaxID=1479 RepID=UPI0022E513B8|nr:isochorismate synthase [Bacillus smithii]